MSPTSARAAVFGIPNDEFGEEVKLAGYELSRSIDVEAALSRQPTGKLYKRLLRDKYVSAA